MVVVEKNIPEELGFLRMSASLLCNLIALSHKYLDKFRIWGITTRTAQKYLYLSFEKVFNQGKKISFRLGNWFPTCCGEKKLLTN